MYDIFPSESTEYLHHLRMMGDQWCMGGFVSYGVSLWN